MAHGTLFGTRELYDVIATAEYLNSFRRASQVAFNRTFCGTSSATLAADERPDLASCVAESPFARVDDLLRHHLDALPKNYLSQNGHQMVRRAVFWLAGKVLLARMGCYCEGYGAIDVVPRLKCPLFVAHSIGIMWCRSSTVWRYSKLQGVRRGAWRSRLHFAGATTPPTALFPIGPGNRHYYSCSLREEGI